MTTTKKRTTSVRDFFMPKNKDQLEYFDEDYQGEDNIDVTKVVCECAPCYGVYLHQTEDDHGDMWFGKEAEEYFGLDGLRQTIDTGCPPGQPYCYNGQGGCLQPDTFHWRRGGEYALLPCNLTTVALAFVTYGNIWEIYWSLIQKHHLEKAEKELFDS